MSILAAYKKRLGERDINEQGSTKPRATDNIKFKPNGEINPFFGLTSIVWIEKETVLFKNLVAYQEAIKADLKRAGLERFFAFLKPSSFHMTLCDILADPAPISSQEADLYVDEVQKVFSDNPEKKPISCEAKGVGLSSTITVLVRFQEKELEKILELEKMVKTATKVDVRDFTGHISLAYLVAEPGEARNSIKEILRSHIKKSFGSLTFSQFDMTCFTDMNTYIPLLSINFVEDQVIRHDNATNCQLA